MNRIAWIGAAIVLALTVDIYVRLRPSPSTSLTAPVAIQSPPPGGVALANTLLPPATVQEAPDVEPDPDEASIKLMGSRLEDPVPSNEVGMVRRLSQIDLQRYFLFMNAGLWSERKSPDMWMFQERYSLADDELKAVTDYATTAIRDDRRFQATERRKLCARRSVLLDAVSLGQALNDFDKAVEAHREQLARNSEAAIGSIIYAKLTTQLLSQPMLEVQYADFPALFEAQNRDLNLEIAHLCDRPWRE